jgi:hypothetical protein
LNQFIPFTFLLTQVKHWNIGWKLWTRVNGCTGTYWTKR